jgi:hypothetical protein
MVDFFKTTGGPAIYSSLASGQLGDITIADVEVINGKPETYSGTITTNAIKTIISNDIGGTREVTILCPQASASSIDFILENSGGSWITIAPGDSYTGSIRIGKIGDGKDLRVRRTPGQLNSAIYNIIATF